MSQFFFGKKKTKTTSKNKPKPRVFLNRYWLKLAKSLRMAGASLTIYQNLIRLGVEEPEALSGYGSPEKGNTPSSSTHYHNLKSRSGPEQHLATVTMEVSAVMTAFVVFCKEV